MKKRYNIKWDIPPLSSEQIAKHKDFASLLAKHQQSPSPTERPARTGAKIVRLLAPLAAVAAAIALFMLVYRPGTQHEPAYLIKEKAFFASQPYVNPPLPKIHATFASQTVDGTAGGILEYENGSRIVVPENAFVHTDGQPVSGEVQIKYREMHDYIDFFLSGIPMYYDSAGVRYQLESAGMMEVFAEQDGQKVRLHPDKELSIELVSQVKTAALDVPPSYNIYKLNTEARAWEYYAEDDMQFLDEPPSQLLINTDPKTYLLNQKTEAVTAIETKVNSAIQKAKEALPKIAKPQKPTMGGDPKLPVFDFDVFGETVDWSALTNNLTTATDNDALKSLTKQELQSSLWQIISVADINQRLLAEIEWEAAKVVPASDNRYEVTVSTADASLSFFVRRVLTGEEFEKALDDYELALASVEQKQAEQEMAWQELQAQIRQQYAGEIQRVEQVFNQKVAAFERGDNDAIQPKAVARKVVSRFQIPDLGIWNCDRPILPSPRELRANFAIDGFQAGRGYVVDKDLNTVYQFHAYDGCPLPAFNQNEDHLLWVVNKEEQIAVYRPGEEIVSQPMLFDMAALEQELLTEADVREALQF